MRSKQRKRRYYRYRVLKAVREEGGRGRGGGGGEADVAGKAGLVPELMPFPAANSLLQVRIILYLIPPSRPKVFTAEAKPT